MDPGFVDEDSIDTEALQAQIDLSMSFAQSLVSSWMEPHRLPTSSRKSDLEKELSEYMKRPPRLGVGASIPEGHQNMSREAARLKGKLTGSNKRLREGEGEAASAPARRTKDDDDEDESRAGAIKKKQKPDLFSITHKKKKKHQAKNDEEPGNSTLCIGQSSSQNLQNDVRKPDSSRDATQSPSKQKSSKFARNEALHDSAPEDLSTLKHSPKKESRVASPNRLSESGHISPISTFPKAIVPRTAELLRLPLLNLTGPPANSNDDESDAAEVGVTQSPLTSPKKRRKRRKKRKHDLTSESVTTAASTVLRGVQT